MQSNSNVFCVDIGGTKTAFAVYSAQGQELFYDCFPTRPEEGAERLVERVYGRVKGALNGVAVGSLASPGPLDTKSGKILSIATMGWSDVAIVRLFEEKFGVPFLLLNDCDAGALGVWSACGFRESRTLCYMSISTGIGGGIVSDGTLFTGNGNAANFGHIPVSAEGRKCACGKTDCLELYASGSGMEKRYSEQTGEELSCAEIAERARKGEETAKRIFCDAADKLSLALGTVVACIDPDTVVLGGSVCKSGDLFLPTVCERLASVNIAFAPESGKQVLYGAFAHATEFSKTKSNKRRTGKDV